MKFLVKNFVPFDIKNIHDQFVTIEIFSDINDSVAKEVANKISLAHISGQSIIPMTINSNGGDVSSMRSIVGEMKGSSLPIMTYVSGKASSAGVYISAFGSKNMRFIDPYAILMIHDFSSFTEGKVHEMSTFNEMLKMDSESFFVELAKHCGHRKHNYFIELFKRYNYTDIYCTPNQAIEYKLADEICNPSIVLEISANYKILR